MPTTPAAPIPSPIAPVSAARADSSDVTLSRTAARTFAIGLGAARVGAGLVQVLLTRRFLTAIGAHQPVQPGTLLGFRMKGARDLALGVGTLSVARDDRALSRTCDAAVVIDGIDGIAVLADRRRTFGPPVGLVGGPAGLVVAVVASWAGRVLRG